MACSKFDIHKVKDKGSSILRTTKQKFKSRGGPLLNSI